MKNLKIIKTLLKTLLKIWLISLLLLPGFSAFAKNKLIKQVADWGYWETDDTLCYITTNNDKKPGDPRGIPNFDSNINFSIIKLKNKPDMPVEIMVQFATNNRKSTAATVSVPGVNPISLSSLNSDGKKLNMWAIPKNIANLLERIKKEQVIKVKGLGGKNSEEIRLSTRGFNDILTKMQNNCNGGASLVNVDFERKFLVNVPEAIDPTRIDAVKTGQLRSIYFAAYKIVADMVPLKADLEKVLAKYQPLIDELIPNRARAEKILNVELPNNQNILAGAKKQQADAAAVIARIDNQIPDLNAKIQASQKSYDATVAILAPHEPEYNRITGSLNAAQAALHGAQNRLGYIDTRLRDGAQQLSALSYEATEIERRLPQRQYDLERARAILRDAQSRRANFNVTWERERRLRESFEYSRLQNDRQNMQRRLYQAEMDVQRIRNERDRVAQNLEQCRMEPITESLSTQFLVPGPPGNPNDPVDPNNPDQPENPDQPGGGLVPGEPGTGDDLTPTPEPARDCSHLEQALNNANSLVYQKERELQDISNRISEISSRLHYIERQIDMEVRREYDNLVYSEDQALREYNRISNDINSDQNRLAQIRNSDIPRLEREQIQLQSERPTVISQISESTAAVQRLSQELVSFKATTDWDNKVAAVNRTRNQLNADQSALRSALASKAEAQRQLEAGAVTEAKTKAQIDSLNAQLSALDQRANFLNEGLKNLPAERAPIDAALSAKQVDFLARENQFVSLLK